MSETKEHNSAPLSNFSSFHINKDIVEALGALGINEPTEVQSAAIPSAMEGGDLIVQAKTGSGKTFAFLLPILSQIISSPNKRKTLAIIISPTRELANQVKKVCESLNLGITPACLIGGESIHRQEQQLKQDARLVVGTPGRIIDMIERRELLLRSCQMFVLDEADEMLSMGFIDDIKIILKKLPTKRQGLFFSATIDSRVAGLANYFLNKPKTIVIESTEENASTIEHFYHQVAGGVTDKANALCKLLSLNQAESAIIFCNTKQDTELVEKVLKRNGFNAQRINSDLKQRERDKVLESLRKGELQFLIATDVAARGIDIKGLELVVNYSLHNEPETYVHRTGRTGRANAKGKAVSLIGPHDFAMFYSLQKRYGVVMSELQLPPQAN